METWGTRFPGFTGLRQFPRSCVWHWYAPLHKLCSRSFILLFSKVFEPDEITGANGLGANQKFARKHFPEHQQKLNVLRNSEMPLFKSELRKETHFELLKLQTLLLQMHRASDAARAVPSFLAVVDAFVTHGFELCLVWKHLIKCRVPDFLSQAQIKEESWDSGNLPLKLAEYPWWKPNNDITTQLHAQREMGHFYWPPCDITRSTLPAYRKWEYMAMEPWWKQDLESKS